MSLLNLPTDHVNVVFNGGSDGGVGDRLVLAPGDNSRKFVCNAAALFVRALEAHAGRVHMLKMKGTVTAADAAAFAPAVQRAVSGTSEVALKAAAFEPCAAAVVAAALLAALPATAILIPAKKVERSAGSFASAEELAALLTPVATTATGASAPPAENIKLKAKLNESTAATQLASVQAAAEVLNAAPPPHAVAALGMPAGTLPTSLKVRGGVTAATVSAASMALTAAHTIHTLKMARYTCASAAVAAQLAHALVAAVRARNKPLTIALKRKGVGTGAVQLNVAAPPNAAAAAAAADVEGASPAQVSVTADEATIALLAGAASQPDAGADAGEELLLAVLQRFSTPEASEA